MSETTGDAADRVYIGKNIITVDKSNADADAVAVKDGKIVFVGSAETAKQRFGTRNIRQLQNDETLLPGFIDPHSHLSGIGLQSLVADLLRPPDGTCTNISQVIETLKTWGEKNPDTAWIFGFGYDDAALGRHPTREELDQVSTDRPVIAVHQSFHMGSVNGAGLRALGFSEDGKPPDDIEDKYVIRDPDTKLPTGVLQESALTKASDAATEGLKSLLNNIFDIAIDTCLKYGFTTVQDGGIKKGTQDVMRDIARTSGFEIDVVIYGQAAEAVKLSKENGTDGSDYINVSRTYKGGLRTAGVKMFLDGSPQGRTAWVTKKYLNNPPGVGEDYLGIQTTEDSDALEQMQMAFKHKWHLLAHANGDAAIDQYLRTISAVNNDQPIPDRRFVAIHSQITRENQVDEYQRLGVIPSFFSMHTFYWGDWYRDEVLGDERYPNISPAQWALRRGLKYTSHHDAPVAYPNSFAILYGQAVRKSRSGETIGEHQRVSMLDAIKSITINAAYQYFEEDTKGSITVGKQADLVILNQNPLTMEDPGPLMEGLKVVETIKGGKILYPRNQPRTFSKASPAALEAEKPILKQMTWSCNC